MVHVETMGNVYAMMTTMEVTAQVNLDFFVVLLIKYNFENMILLHSVFYSMSQLLFFFYPVACEAATNCNGHGTCKGDGTCECDSHFFSADCTSKL